MVKATAWGHMEVFFVLGGLWPSMDVTTHSLYVSLLGFMHSDRCCTVLANFCKVFDLICVFELVGMHSPC